MITATISVSAKKIQSRVSSVFLIILPSSCCELWFEINGQKSLHERLRTAPHFFRCSERKYFSFVHHCDSVSDTESQIPIVRYDQRRDADALLEIENLFADRHR